MKIDETGLSGLKVLTPLRFWDTRGSFSESWNKCLLAQHGIDIDFIQDNHSFSAVGEYRAGPEF